VTTAAEAVVDLLAGAGVRRFYTVPGESFLELLDEVERRPDLRLISARHESGAAFMAEADGKLTGRPAVVMATRGVGAANLAIGVHTARQDSTPMLALLGQVETDHLGKEAFQEVDLGRFYDEITV
jgi:acetolactate synthase-1/2/3 large subunit